VVSRCVFEEIFLLLLFLIPEPVIVQALIKHSLLRSYSVDSLVKIFQNNLFSK